MSPELHRRLRELFEQAILLPEDQRQAFLRAQCPDNPELLQTAARLVAAHAESRQFLSSGSDAKRYGRYVVLREIGRGSMAIVYEAEDPAIGRKVALKVLRVESLDAAKLQLLKDRMFREAQSGGMLSHPGIVTVFDVGQQGDETFIAMELVAGQTLQELLETNSHPGWKVTQDILAQSAAALDYAHQRGVVHRDIKPANIMIDRNHMVKIADFGVAKINAAQMKTVTGFVFGTPAYMSPEQIQMRKLDGRSDQFALAVVAYQMCAGAAPFRADSIASLAHQIVYEDPPPVAQVSKSMDKALRRALSKEPAQRYGSCAEMVRALDAAMKLAPASGRGNLAYWTSGGAAALLLAGGIVVYRGRVKISPANPAPHTAVASSPVTRSPEKAPSVIATPVAPPPAKAPPAAPAPRRKDVFADAVSAREAGQTKKAIALFEQAAQAGDVKAMAELGELFSDQDPPDYTNARLWFERAADEGNTAAMVHLGVMYQWKLGVPEDAERAVYWYNRGVQGLNPIAMYNLACMYLDGQKVSKDVSKAKGLFRAAASLGDANAKARLAALEGSGK